jgi:hypothetical protein
MIRRAFQSLIDGLAVIGRSLTGFTIMPSSNIDYTVGRDGRRVRQELEDIQKQYETAAEKASYRSPIRGFRIHLEWQGLEAAPRDGTSVLLCVNCYGTEVPLTGFYDQKALCWRILAYPKGTKTVSEHRVLGWHPIPATAT